MEGSPQLSLTARQALEDENNETWLSAASVWEMAIKISTDKLALSQPLPEYIADQTSRNGIQLLPQVMHVATLPFLHRDPFDRLIVAQCELESLPLISADQVSTNTVYSVSGDVRLAQTAIPISDLSSRRAITIYCRGAAGRINPPPPPTPSPALAAARRRRPCFAR